MKSQELRDKYFEFFKQKGHALISPASLIPENDPTVLFTTAGMHPLVPYLMGEKHPEGSRLVDVQKCIRTDDIEEVGDSTHHTFFEMLGNWSLGDYFKEEAIKMSYEFMTSPDWLGLNKEKIAISVFAGDKDAPFDEEAYNIWQGLGIPESKIARLPKENNWWGPAGATGPCGPDTEIFYWAGPIDQMPETFNDDNDLWIEVWNNVFMQYDKKPDGTYEPLKQKNVDTGMGLERILAVINGFEDNYQTDLWKNVIHRIEHLSDKEYGSDKNITKAMRIVADHVKASVFIIGDRQGVAPSNTDQGYVVRRLLRRAMVYGKKLSIEGDDWISDLADQVIMDYEEAYPELSSNHNFILNSIKEEQLKFNRTLENGLKEFNKECEELACEIGDKTNDIEITIPGDIIFKLVSTYGFPMELISEIARERKMAIDEEGYMEEMKKHRELSRTASAGMFKGGLADASAETKKLHTAAHLLLSALRQVLGDHVVQKGSNITPERLRFDFSHTEKMTDEQKVEVEKLVNQAIEADLPIVCQEKPISEAKEEGAMGVFDSKYGERVKVYTIGISSAGSVNSPQKGSEAPFSREICGGPHVEKTGELGHFRIKKEESSSAGIRRIKAVLE